MTVAFIDTETTGLDPQIHPIWEIAVIVDNTEYVWQQCLSAHEIADIDPIAAKINNFYDRYKVDEAMSRLKSAQFFANLVKDRHLVGAVVSFDEERLRRQYVEHFGYPERFPWHYHIIDVEAMAVGFLHGWGQARGNATVPSLPWKSETLSSMLHIEPSSDEERHTALGDARWAKRMYEAMVPS